MPKTRNLSRSQFDQFDGQISRLTKRLIRENILGANQVDRIVQQALQSGNSLVSELQKIEHLNHNALTIAAAQEFGIPYIDIAAIDLTLCPQDLITPSLLSKYCVLPIAVKDRTLLLAIADPCNSCTVDDLKFHTGLNILTIVTAKHSLDLAIDKFTQRQFPDQWRSSIGDLHASSRPKTQQGNDINIGDSSATDETPIVTFVNKILHDAVAMKASDIHFEPYENNYRVRIRLDGLLQEIAHLPAKLSNRVSSRIKVLAQMNIAEKRLPQDGRIKLSLADFGAIDFRANSLPTLWGEKIVLRIQDNNRIQLNLAAIGMKESQQEIYRTALRRQQGMILITGPTGSGKTVSLYSGLRQLNITQRNISTCEDPVEFNLEGVNQVSINPRAGLDFATVLRAFLRQDPDVVMVGEIRDPDTAEIAIKAAQTGHLVLSTLHTNNAAETLTRLLNMGVPAYNLATSVSLIIAQRLLRQLCPECKESAQLPEKVMIEAGFSAQQCQSATLYKPRGCERCHEGYSGRTGIYEVVPVTDAIGRIIMANGNSLELADEARKEGFFSLRQSALDKVAQGLTSLEEANRLTQTGDNSALGRKHPGNDN